MRSQRLSFPGHDGTALAGRLEEPEGPIRAYAIFAHCFTCSKDSAAAGRISRALAQRGIATLRFDFTGLGGSDGDFANTNFSSNVADLVSAAEFLAAHHGAPRLLVGHSLGGAAVLAAASDIDSIVAVATIGAPSDPGHVEHLFAGALDTIRGQGQAEVCLAGRRFTVKDQFLDDLEETRFRERLRALDDLAVLILHAPDDEVVHIDHARRLYAQLEHPKSFVSLPGADHLLTQRAEALYAADVLAAWVSRYLPAAPDGDRSTPAAARGDGVADDLAEGTVRVGGDGNGFVQDIRAGVHDLVADEPTRLGGTDLGPTPYDLLLAALGSCTSMTLGMYARKKGWPLEHVAVDLRHARIHAEDCADCETETGTVDQITRKIALHGPLDDAQRARLLEIADRCPVHRTLEAEIVIRSELAPETARSQP